MTDSQACIKWTGFIDRDGYGVVKIDRSPIGSIDFDVEGYRKGGGMVKRFSPVNEMGEAVPCVLAADYDALLDECTAAMKRNGEYLKALHAVDDYWHGPGDTTYGEASDAVHAALAPGSPKGG